jgi:hypothetical protein
MQGAQKLRREAHLLVRRNDEVEAQRRRWTFYETIHIHAIKRARMRSREKWRREIGSMRIRPDFFSVFREKMVKR